TEILELDEPYDDLYDEEIEGDYRDDEDYDDYDDYEDYDDYDDRGSGSQDRASDEARDGVRDDRDDRDGLSLLDDSDEREDSEYVDEEDEEEPDTQREGRVRRLLKWAAVLAVLVGLSAAAFFGDRKSTRLNSSHVKISYAVFCL